MNADATVGSGTRICCRNSAASIHSASAIIPTAGVTDYNVTFNNTQERYLSVLCDYSDDRIPVDFWIYDLQIEVVPAPGRPLRQFAVR